MTELYFVKLGGSLITAKSQTMKPRLDTIARLAQEIQLALASNPGLQLLLGHGSGSFGHVPARQHQTRQGAHSPEEWLGFQEVWWAAARLNQLVNETFIKHDLPVISLPPSASILASKGQIKHWNISPIQRCLDTQLIPIIYGDVVFDESQGATILSTEDLFSYLTPQLHPDRILLVGLEIGVWQDYPRRSRLYSEINSANVDAIFPTIRGSDATDVTGGMASKVQQSCSLVQSNPGTDVLIFSGEKPGRLNEALNGIVHGTRIFNSGLK